MHYIGDVYVSEILKKQVLDPKGEESGRLDDFIITLGELFPRVSGLLVSRKGVLYRVPWDQVGIFNKKIVSTNLSFEAIPKFETGKGEMLACRELLDKQIVDINGAKVVRVNDLKLGEVKGSLCLIAADVGAAGLFRRLGLKKQWEGIANLLGIQYSTNLISWNYLQPLQPQLGKLALTVSRKQMGALHPADIAQIISEVSQKDRRAILESLDIETAAETIHELEPSVQADIIAHMDEEQAADILEAMPPDEAADLVADLPEDKAHGILQRMEAEDAEDVQELLEHEDDTAGGLMTTEYLSFPPEMTVSESMIEYRLAAPDVESASAYVIYVLDAEERLLGEVHLKDLVLAHPDKRLDEIMHTEFKSASPEDDEREVAEKISKYNLLALPVVEEERMLGIVTVDDILDLFLPPQSRRKKHRMK
ncbi:MAG: magnesium transporter [Nitrospirota bacterium]